MMLVLSRRIGEELVIDGDIRVIVASVNGSTVRLGIAAPPIVSIVRRELIGNADEPASDPAERSGTIARMS
jgi:carbon storage regulator